MHHIVFLRIRFEALAWIRLAHSRQAAVGFALVLLQGLQKASTGSIRMLLLAYAILYFKYEAVVG